MDLHGPLRIAIRAGTRLQRRLGSAQTRRRDAALARWQGETHESGLLALAGDSLIARLPPALLDHGSLSLLSRGLGGETVGELLDRIDEVIARDPRAIVLQTGTNDLLQGRRVDALERDYRALLAQFDGRHEVIVMALPPIAARRVRDGLVSDANERIAAAASSAGAAYVDTFNALADPVGLPRTGMSTDGVHLTEAGYRVLAGLLNDALARLR